jgi:hypothetical protein
MVSPGELRLIETLTETEAFEPEIADNGDVGYPNARQRLDGADDDAVDILERFTARGVLSSEFVSKVYICPECTAEGMQYTTVCPACESLRATERTVFEHDCGYAGTRSAFDGEDGTISCPDCEVPLDAETAEETRRYVCEECSELADMPGSRLRCRDCLLVIPPREAIERVLYRYSLTADGERWHDRQKQVLQTVAEALRERRFETEIDATVSDGTDARAVHLLAEDELMGERRVVSLHETPDADHVEAFCAFADAVDAQPIVVTTSGAVEEAVATRAEGPQLTVLTVDEAGEVGMTYRTVEDARSPQGFLSRLTAAIDVPVGKGQQ